MFEKFKKETVRDAFGKCLCEIAEEEERIVLISGDSQGASKTTGFHQKFQNRSYNLGIAEQNMVGVAAGMAYEGYIPWVSTRAPFLSMRAAEQVRTCICYDRLPVRLVGTGGGYCSGTAGSTHWALEDVAIMSSFGNMTVFETGDKILLEKIMKKSLQWEYPMYIRLGRDSERTIYNAAIEIELGNAIEVKEGIDGYYIVSGTTVEYAVDAAERLYIQYGLKIGVMDMFTVKPIDEESIKKAARTGHVVVAQDHNIIGGLGSMVSLVMARQGISCNVKILGCPDYFVPVANADYLYHKFGYDTDGLAENMRGMLL